MTLRLTDRDNELLSGSAGEGARMAMRIVVRLAEAQGVDELMDISQAHIDGCGLLSAAGLEFAEALASKGAHVVVPTTLNMGPLDLQNWRKFGIGEDFAGDAIRQGKAYTEMGCVPTWSCAPYQGYLTPRFGQQIAWGESNAVCYANSIIGARTNRYGDYIDICAAITGRVARCGLHLAENRRGQILVTLKDVPESVMACDSFYPAFGHLLGHLAGDKVAVVDGLAAGPQSDQFKAICAAAASSGQVALFHIVGITPEAATLEDAFQGRAAESTVEVTLDDLIKARDDLSTARQGDKLDVVLLGCPHFSFDEFRKLAEVVGRVKRQGHKLHPDVRFIVISCESSYALARRGGFLEELVDFGIEISLDTCAFHTPMIADDARVIMTDSGKCAYYAPGELAVDVAFGSIADCVESAVAGCVRQDELVKSWKQF